MTDGNDPKYARLETTQWSLVGRAQNLDARIRSTAMEELLRTYYPALRAHLVFKKKVRTERADDLLQGFIAEKILERDLVSQADRSKGHFRSLLLRSLENYAVDQLRREIARRLPGSQENLDDRELQGLSGGRVATSDIFDVAWARTVLTKTLDRMRETCKQEGRSDIWNIFEARVVRPTLSGTEPPSYKQMVIEFGFQSPADPSNALVTAKRRFKRILYSVIACYTEDDKQVEEEVVNLQRILNASGPLNLELSSHCLSRETTPKKTSVLDVDESQTRLLAKMLDSSGPQVSTWQDEDLRGLFQHQLDTSLASAFEYPESGESPTLTQLGKSSVPPIVTFADLLKHDQPPLELLHAMRRMARRSAKETSGAIPDEIASVLYFAAIAVARVRLGERISRSDDNVLRYGFEIMMRRAWIGKDLTEVFGQSLEKIDEEI